MKTRVKTHKNSTHLRPIVSPPRRYSTLRRKESSSRPLRTVHSNSGIGCCQRATLSPAPGSAAIPLDSEYRIPQA